MKSTLKLISVFLLGCFTSSAISFLTAPATTEIKQSSGKIQPSSIQSTLGANAELLEKQALGSWEQELHFLEVGRSHRRAAASLESLDKLASKTKDRMALLKGYFLEWARQDPAKALHHLMARPGTKEVADLKILVLKEWASSGAGADALSWVFHNVRPEEQFFLGTGLISAWMDVDPQAVVKNLSGSRQPAARNLLKMAVTKWGEEDPQALSLWLSSEVANPAAEAVRPQALAGIGHSDPATAWKMFDETVRRKTTSSVGQVSMEEALTQLGGLAAEYVESAAVIFQEWAVADANEAARQAAHVQAGNLRHAAMQGLAAGWSERDPYAAASWFAQAAFRDRTAAEALVTATTKLTREPIHEIARRVKAVTQGDKAAQDRIFSALAQAAAQNNQLDTALEATSMIADPKTAAATAEIISSIQ